MTSRIRRITYESANPLALAGFWSQVTGYREDPEDPNSPDHAEALLISPHGGPGPLSVPVPEGRTVKNRIQLDMVPTERARDEEVARPLAIGATLVADHRNADGTGWAVLADPDGNEFCDERGIAERSAPAA